MPQVMLISHRCRRLRLEDDCCHSSAFLGLFRRAGREWSGCSLLTTAVMKCSSHLLWIFTSHNTVIAQYD